MRDSVGRLFTHEPEYTVPYMEHLKSCTDICYRGISFFLNQPSLYRVAPRLLNTILRVMGVIVSAAFPRLVSSGWGEALDPGLGARFVEPGQMS